MANSSILLEMKEKVLRELISDPQIVQTIDSGTISADEPDKLIGTHIFRYHSNPDAWTQTATYLTVQMQIPEASENKKWVHPALEIHIISHPQHMEMETSEASGGVINRNDYLAKLLDMKFNGRSDLGGQTRLLLQSNTEGVLDNQYPYRRLLFVTSDLNETMTF